MDMEKEYEQLTKAVMGVRRLKCMSQVELGEKTGLTQKEISNIETGKKVMSMVTFLKLVKALNLNVRVGLNKDCDCCNEEGEQDGR